MSSETPQTNIKEKKDLKKNSELYWRNTGQFLTMCKYLHSWNVKRRGKNGAEEIFEVNIGWGLSKINDNKSQIQKGQNTPRTIN